MIEPTLQIAPASPQAPVDHWLKRAFVALFRERRLPYRAALLLDAAANRLGFRRKTVKAAGFAVRVRRQTCDEEFVQNILVNREYTPAGYAIEKRDVVVDIGGNIGTFALLAGRQAADGRVVTIEPQGENFQLLSENLALNRSRNVSAVHAAVGGAAGSLKLFTAAQGGFHSVLADRADAPDRYELVRSVALKDVFDSYRIERCNFLKVDCEGAEYDILYNLPAEYFGRIDKIVMEYHGDGDKSKRRIQSDGLVSHLEAMGFRIDEYTEYPAPFRGGMLRARRTAHPLQPPSSHE